MGFKFSELGKNTCTFKALEEGDDRRDLLVCIQQALSTSRLEIIVDLTGRPQALEHIMSELLSLQRVLVNHSKVLKIKGLGDLVPPELLATLGQNKIELEFSKPTDGFASHDPAMQSVNPSTGAPATPEVSAPTFTADVSSRLLELKNRLAGVIRKKRDLELEKKFYDERLKILMKGQNPSNVSSERIQDISLMEREHIELNDQIHLLTKQAAEAEALAKETEAQNKASKTQLIDDLKKKREPFDKKLSELKVKQEKTKADFEKKSLQRNSQLASLIKSAKPVP